MNKNLITLVTLLTVLLSLNIVVFRNNLIITAICSIGIVIIAAKLIAQVLIAKNKEL